MASPATPIRLAAPPAVPSDDGNGVLQVLLPAVGTLSVVAFAFVVKSKIYLIVAALMVVAMIGGSIATNVTQRRRRARKRARDHAAYQRHLAEVRRKAERAAEVQRAGLAGLYPPAGELLSIVSEHRACWERRSADPDFASVRLGLGQVPASAPVELDANSDPLSSLEPDLAQAAETVVRDHAALSQAPVTVSLRGVPVIAVVGDRARARDLVGSWFASLAAFHAPGDLRLLGLVPEDAVADWDWAKWLPHLRDPLGGDGFGRASRSLVADPALFLDQLDALVRPRLEQAARAEEAASLGRADLVVEHAVVVIDGYQPSTPVGSSRQLEQLLHNAPRVKASVVVLVDGPEHLPSVCAARVDLNDDGACTYVETGPSGRIDLGIREEPLERAGAAQLARFLAPLRLTGDEAHADLVDALRLSDLVGLEHAGEFDPDSAWLRLADLASRPADIETDAEVTRPDPESLLTAPIGVAADGSTVLLDIKEAAAGGMGPHGILVGATGSGKSELLRTAALSLAARHDPELLSFVLVDFKGGAAFAGLERLPHVAGVITNLVHDLALVDRVRAALTGELERRQEMLRQAGNLDSIRDYHARQAAGAELPELPYLVVVVDEFGELLGARPEFLDTFIAIGRLGRSLGVHLLLATQRLDEGRIRGLEPHLRYRICLQTFSAAESQAVIGSAAAFELPPLPGLGFLRVDAAMSRFKAALVSTPYRAPTGKVFRDVGASELVRPFQLGAEGARPTARTPGVFEVDRTDLAVMVDGMHDAARVRHTHQVWLPPLPNVMTLGDVFASMPNKPHRLEAPLGMLDIPEHQRQEALVLDLGGVGGNVALVGAPRTGKTTLLTSLVLSLCSLHTSEEVQIYAMDLAGGGLHVLADLPHVGAVVGRHEPDMLVRLLREIRALLDERTALARQHRANSLQQLREYCAAAGDPRGGLPDTFLVIDGAGLLRTNYPDLEQEVSELASTGLQFGVHVVVASGRWLDMRPALLDALGARLELRLNDPLDSMAGKAAASALPELPGRGLTRQGTYFQVALPALVLSAALGAHDAELRRSIKLVAEHEAGRQAPRIPPLPERVRVTDVAVEGFADERFLLGVQEFRLLPVQVDLLTPGAHLLVYGDGESGRTTVLRRAVSHLLSHGPDEVSVHVVDVGRGLLDLASLPGVEEYAFTTEQAVTLAGSLAKRLADRQPPADLTLEKLRVGGWWTGPRHVLVVDDYELLLGPSGGPFTDLVDALGQARDVGFHVLLARRAAGSQRTSFEPFGQRLREVGATGLLLSGPPNEGPLVGNVSAAQQPPGRGLLVRPKERTILVQCCVDEADHDAASGVAR